MIIRGYLAGLGFVIDLIMRREHDAVLSGGFLGTWSTWAAGISNTGFALHTPDAQHLYGGNSSNVRYIWDSSSHLFKKKKNYQHELY